MRTINETYFVPSLQTSNLLIYKPAVKGANALINLDAAIMPMREPGAIKLSSFSHLYRLCQQFPNSFICMSAKSPSEVDVSCNSFVKIDTKYVSFVCQVNTSNKELLEEIHRLQGMQRGRSLNESFDSEGFNEADALQQRVRINLICSHFKD